MNSDEVKVIKTDENAKTGETTCPRCGSTEISLNINNGKLRCHYCRNEFEPKQVEGFETDISKLEGQVIASGASDIAADASDVLTFKCSSCGADIVVDTASSTNARCHWCRSTLSINEQIPNGAVPDVVLPFAIKKEDAQKEIQKFVGKRKFFAHPQFKKEFTTSNIMGVYFPYMIVDVNGHANLSGEAEKQIRCYTIKSGNTEHTYYDANAYKVEREFDIAISGLTVESSSDKLNKTASDKTNNIINSIMPFDTEKAVKWDANYLKGFTSEKRDTNIDDLRLLVSNQSKDIARFSANDTLKEYDRGVAWKSEQFDIKGQQWKSAYLPVWLYSYQQVKGDKKLLHYVAVNARTRETMGSVPIHMPKLIGVSAIVEVIGVLLTILTYNPNSDKNYSWIFLLMGIAFYIIMYLRYRNSNARHHHETETKSSKGDVRKYDSFIEIRKKLSSSKIVGCNNMSVSNTSVQLKEDLKDSIINSNSTVSLIKNVVNKTNNNK